jgi:protein-S-isoprenylcysteine O-methyltransferase Ste14
VVSPGICGRLRHPSCLHDMLMLLSTGLVTGALAIFLLAILDILLYQILARLQERALLDQYGPEYEA